MQNKKNDQENRTRINYYIRASRILVIHEGVKLGEMHPKDAMLKAESLGLDLIEISPHTRPPVCIIADYGKWKYNQSKKEKQSAATSSKTEVKTVRLRQNTEDNDVNTKIALIKKFLESGKRVQLQIRSKGRELAHKDRGLEIANRIIKELESVGQPETKPSINGNEVNCKINPL